MFCRHFPITHGAAINKHGVGEPAVALGDKLDVVGALQKHGLVQAACLLVQVGDAVLAVVGDVLGGTAGQQAHESELSCHLLGGHPFHVVFKLWRGR